MAAHELAGLASSRDLGQWFVWVDPPRNLVSELVARNLAKSTHYLAKGHRSWLMIKKSMPSQRYTLLVAVPKKQGRTPSFIAHVYYNLHIRSLLLFIAFNDYLGIVVMKHER
jgi:hypothetical protein